MKYYWLYDSLVNLPRSLVNPLVPIPTYTRLDLASLVNAFILRSTYTA